jgi:glycosyltransferase involved in cell wall biosynthesis
VVGPTLALSPKVEGCHSLKSKKVRPNLVAASNLAQGGVPQPATLPMLSVIVPAYNGALQLSRCLEGLRLSEYSNFEVIVVDDCSNDNTRQIAERYGVRSVQTPFTSGPAAARNLGAAMAQASTIVFVDADVVLPPNALALIAQEFTRDAQLAALFGSYDEEPAWDHFLSQYKNLMHCYVHQNSREEATTFWAGCGAIRKDIFLQFGGFNATRYNKPSIEDIELGCRLVDGGQKVRLLKELRVKHLKRWTLRGLLRTDILCRAVPWTKLILETNRLPRDLNLTYRARASTGLVGLLSIVLVMLLIQAPRLVQLISVPRVLLIELFVMTVTTPMLVALNWDLYAFFARRRGWWFAGRVVPMHWFYYLYSGVVFVTCAAAQKACFFVVPVRPLAWGSRSASDK